MVDDFFRSLIRLGCEFFPRRSARFIPAEKQFKTVPDQETQESYFPIYHVFVFGKCMDLAQLSERCLTAPAVRVVASRFCRSLDLTEGFIAKPKSDVSRFLCPFVFVHSDPPNLVVWCPFNLRQFATEALY